MNNILESVFKELLKNRIVITEADEEEAKSTSEGAAVKTVLRLPKFKINEKKWGTKLNTEDRAIIEQIGRNLEGDDPLSRIKYVNEFLSEQSEIKGDITVGKVMGTLMFLDIFASIVYEFNPSVAGFLFEALFAGIFEGEQIEAAKGGGEAGTTDVILFVGSGTSKQGVEYSFKLLTEGATTIAGSAVDILNGIKKSSDASETYLIGLKSEEGKESLKIDFYEFKIGQENWFDWIGTVNKSVKEDIFGDVEFTTEQIPRLRNEIKLVVPRSKVLGKTINGQFVKQPKSGTAERTTFDQSPEEMIAGVLVNPEALKEPHNLRHANGTPVEEGTYLVPNEKYIVNGVKEVKIRPNYYDKSSNFYKLYGELLNKEGDKFIEYIESGAYKNDKGLFDKLAELTSFQGGKGTGQFVITQNYLKTKGKGVEGPATVVLDRAKFLAAAERYTKVIGNQIYQVFTDMANLIDDVSGYYLGSGVAERFEMGLAAKEEAARLAVSTEKNFKEIEVAEDTRKALEKNARRRMSMRGDTTGFSTGAGAYGGGPGGVDESKKLDLQEFSRSLLENIIKK